MNGRISLWTGNIGWCSSFEFARCPLWANDSALTVQGYNSIYLSLTRIIFLLTFCASHFHLNVDDRMCNTSVEQVKCLVPDGTWTVRSKQIVPIVEASISVIMDICPKPARPLRFRTAYIYSSIIVLVNWGKPHVIYSAYFSPEVSYGWKRSVITETWIEIKIN